MAQPSLFDYAAAQRSRDRAIEQVTEGTSVWWIHEAVIAIEICSSSLRDGFTTDDVWRYMIDTGINHDGLDHRAMGAAMNQARKMGLIEPTGRVRASIQKSCHARPKMIWRKA